MQLRKLYDTYKNILSYIFFGVCTTLVNTVVYWFCAHILDLSIMLSTVSAWILAVLFAYITNRKWVFSSTAKTYDAIIKEVFSFFGCRLATGIVDWSCMFVFVDLLKLHDVTIKFLANMLVIVLNYIASKLIIFKIRE